MASSRHPGRSRSTLAVLVLISITVITLDFRGFGPLEGVKSGINTVFSPIRAVGDAVFGPIGDAWTNIFGGGDLEAENERLRREVDELRGADARAEEAEAQVDAMREALDLLPRPDINKTPAEVIDGPPSNFDRTIRLNKGASSGIEPGNPVVTAAGLVGRVVEVSLNHATVQLITDPGFRLGVLHSRSGDVGVAQGRGEGQPLVVDVGLDASTEIAEDDNFMTSGVDRSLFPEGVAVGKVSAITETGDEDGAGDEGAGDQTEGEGGSGPLEQSVEIEPLADLEHLKFVAVMLWTPED